MADTGIPDKFLPAIRVAVFWVGLPFILLLVGIERFFDANGSRYEITVCFIGALLSVVIAVYWNKLIPGRFRKEISQSLKYLTSRDTTLGSAIISMAGQSAWGRWYAVQHLVNTGNPIDEFNLYQIATSVVMPKILDGDLVVRGRRPNPDRLDYEVIPRTDWHSSALHFVRDPISLWRMRVIPTGGATIEADGTIRASDNIAAQRTSLLDYDSLIIDAYQFESLWPQKSKCADKKRRKLLRQARRRGLNKDEIRRLS
jgi:hypothetical protein